MASYSVAQSKHATLVAATVDTVTLAAEYPEVEVVNRSATTTDLLFFTLDGSTPAALGDNSFVVRAGEVLRVSTVGSKTVKLVSATTPAYSVTGIRS